MRIKILWSALTFILAIVLSGYIHLSVSAGRALSASEFTRFFHTILWAAVLHMDENGGSRALKLSREAVSSAPSSGVIKTAGETFQFPLPQFCVSRDEHQQSRQYLTFASFDELQDYFHKTLPQAGWRHVDQMGAGHFFKGHGARIVITNHFYLTTGISELNVSVRKASGETQSERSY